MTTYRIRLRRHAVQEAALTIRADTIQEAEDRALDYAQQGLGWRVVSIGNVAVCGLPEPVADVVPFRKVEK